MKHSYHLLPEASLPEGFQVPEQICFWTVKPGSPELRDLGLGFARRLQIPPAAFYSWRDFRCFRRRRSAGCSV